MYEREALLELLRHQTSTARADPKRELDCVPVEPVCPLTRSPLPWHYILPFPEAKEAIRSAARRRRWRQVWRHVDTWLWSP